MSKKGKNDIVEHILYIFEYAGWTIFYPTTVSLAGLLMATCYQQNLAKMCTQNVVSIK